MQLASSHMSLLSMPLFYSMLGEPLTVTPTSVRWGKMYFTESHVPEVYGSMNSRRAFIDLLWALTLMFSCVSVSFEGYQFMV